MNLKIREWSRVNDVIPYGLRARKSTNLYFIIEVCMYTGSFYYTSKNVRKIYSQSRMPGTHWVPVALLLRPRVPHGTESTPETQGGREAVLSCSHWRTPCWGEVGWRSTSRKRSGGLWRECWPEPEVWQPTTFGTLRKWGSPFGSLFSCLRNTGKGKGCPLRWLAVKKWALICSLPPPFDVSG